jgi:glucose/arabinose dehydrogenase
VHCFRLLSIIFAVSIASALSSSRAQDVTPAAPPWSKPSKKPAPKRPPLQLSVAQSYSMVKVRSDGSPSNADVPKAVFIKLADGKAGVAFDTDLLRFAAGWTGGFLDISKTNIGAPLLKGNDPASPAGPVCWSTKAVFGWSHDGKFTDPREKPFGPAPADIARYNGYYRNGQSVILSYRVLDTDVLELPGAFESNGASVFTRTLQIGPTSQPLFVLLSDQDDAPAAGKITAKTLSGPFSARVFGAPGAAISKSNDGRIVLQIPALKQSTKLQVVLARMSQNELDQIVRPAGTEVPLADLCHGGPTQFTQTITTQGSRGLEAGAYVVDTIALPTNNPWKYPISPGAFDFFPDGRAALCTFHGDVWIISHIDDDLQHVTWKRFATGLYEPLGLKIINNDIYVTGKDQITRLRDLNGDGEADYYENFCNLGVTSTSYHAFAFDLQTDSAGNLYWLVDGNLVDPIVPLHGCMMKASPDGKTLSVYARGMRAPNGMAIGPNDEIVCSDNQGHWTPSSRINLVKPGGFYGYNGDPRKTPFPKPANYPTSRPTYDAPICWIPMAADNSSGGEVFVTSDKWGPLKGQLLHTSYGSCSLFLVMTETIADQMQGAVYRFPLNFESGIMRARFNPVDGQLYVCGLRGWQTAANKDGCFQRVRYTGKPAHMPVAVNIRKTGVKITFTDPLNPESAGDPGGYDMRQWNYIWSSRYGSPNVSVTNPKKTGPDVEDTVDLTAAQLSPDHMSVFLAIPNLAPVMQYSIKYDVKAADGAPMSQEIDGTINRLPSRD